MEKGIRIKERFCTLAQALEGGVGRSTKRVPGQSKFKEKSRSKSKGKGNRPTCWVCGEEGHFKRDCPKRSSQKGKEKSFQYGESSSVTGVDFIESLVVTEANMVTTVDFNEIWILDTVCSFHMTPRKDLFTELNESAGGSVRMANNSLSSVEGIGMVTLKTAEGQFVSVKNVRYVPQFSRNLVSLGALESNGCTFVSENGVLRVKKGCRTVLKATREGNLYYLQGNSHMGEVNAVSVQDETHLWHSRLGHISHKGIDVLIRKGYLDKAKVSSIKFCESCILEKAHRVSFASGKHTSEVCLDYVHADLWGSPSVPASLRKCHYFLSLIDDYSRKVWVFFLKTKYQAFEKFVEWKLLVDN